ncbi:MAG TPA: GMC family oxidoreductase [Vicinamibacterales bacterium]|nr:GMC family oxidoreductase [Vicinamibacterales bacterium]
MTRYEADVVIIGGGISAALLAWTLSERRPGTSILIVEAGDRMFDAQQRWQQRQRMLDYGEDPWPGDYVPDQAGEGVISRSMVVGGSAMHWGGVTNRFSEEDTRLMSMFGLATDWPITYSELERYYCEAERRLGVSGDPSPLPEDTRSEPYPMKGMPLSWNLEQLKAWGEKSGIPFWGTPQAKNTEPYDGRGECRRCNTCEICPTQARYAPDHTFKRLLDAKAIALHDRTIVRRLAAAAGPGAASIEVAHAVHRDRPNDAVEYRAKTFVVASGYAWSAHLLLLSASSRFPNGLANSSGLVGKYMAGHAFIQTQIELDAEIYPGMNEQHSLISRQFFRADPKRPFVRHDLRLWESAVNRGPRLRDERGQLLLGDAVMADWRTRTTRASARVRAYYDLHPDKSSELTLDAARKNGYGDPLPKVVHRPDAASRARHDATVTHIRGVFERLAAHGNATMRPLNFGTYWDHPAGGCRMGLDPDTSVTDSYGRTHDHANLFVVGAPTLPTAGCTNGTLTFAALTLRSADHIAAALGGVSPEARK